jgi:hypothetical protein
VSDEPRVCIDLTVVSPGKASDSAYLAARDLAEVADRIGVAYRLIGGISTGLLTRVHGVSDLVPGRETVDADFGAMPEVIGDARLPVALADRGYRQIEGNRFLRRQLRPDGSTSDLVVDLVVPSWTGRLQNNRCLGQLWVDEVPGLSLALARSATVVEAEIHLTDGETLFTILALPDVTSALCLKAYAYRDRLSARDAVDIWRLLEAASAASVRAEDWVLRGARLDAARVLHSDFAHRTARGPSKASADPTVQRRIRALVRHVVADPRGSTATTDGPPR